jgi:hypothetical protein
MTDKTRSQLIYDRAHILAASGKFRYPGAVVTALISEGYPEAASMFDTPVIQADMKMLCEGSSSSDILALLCEGNLSRLEQSGLALKASTSARLIDLAASFDDQSELTGAQAA